MTRSAWSLALSLLLLLFAFGAKAHEIRPAYLEITEGDNQGIHVLWKQPVVGKVAAPLTPRLSSGWLAEDKAQLSFTESFLIRQWDVAAGHVPLHGQQLVIDGLDRTITDVLVRIRFASGTTVTQLVKPEHPQYEIREPGVSMLGVTQYFSLGVEHIWTGIDHLLYIFGLMLLVNGTRTLVKTITAFTVAHSITLGAAALKLVEVNPAQIELIIALSIVYVAVEVVHKRQGRPGLAARYPWIVAFTFGLLHGFGFAGALAEIGLPQDAIPAALFLFNVGIEAGQLAFVLAITLSLAALKAIWPWLHRWVPRLSPHLIGSLASFWCFERAVHIF